MYILTFVYINFPFSNIFKQIWHEFQTFVHVKFVCTNIFRHSFMSVLESENRPNIRIYSNIRTIFNTNIYSDIRSCQIFYMNIFGHSFVWIYWCKYIWIFVRVEIVTNVTLWFRNSPDLLKLQKTAWFLKQETNCPIIISKIVLKSMLWHRSKSSFVFFTPSYPQPPLFFILHLFLLWKPSPLVIKAKEANLV